jgi:hypothetical protein
LTTPISRLKLMRNSMKMSRKLEIRSAGSKERGEGER